MRFPVPPAVVRVCATPLLNALCRSWRYRTHGEERWLRAVADPKPYIFVLWHEAILPLLWRHQHKGIAIVVSQGREGRYVGDYASGLGYRLLSGSSSRGGPRALLGAVRTLEDGHPVAITPDGPKGPRRELKPGVVQAAQRAGALVVPLHAIAHPVWQAGSWDRMVIPKPRADVLVGYGEPFRVGPGTAGLSEGVEQCRQAMATLELEMVAR
jgi:lysophospholipid acyltransferase (LPLAT)-like uncharacterized protein